jgi:Ca2+-binding EF-hand superfamily protein
LKSEVQAHAGSAEGISSIISIDTESKMIRGNVDDSAKFIATAAWGVPEFRIWKYDMKEATLSKHIKVDSSMSQGIKFLMQSSPTQIVAVDHEKTLKFYDFEKKIDEFDEAVEAIWKVYDVSGDGVLDKNEAEKFFHDMLKELNMPDNEVSQKVLMDIFDKNSDGIITKLEMRTLLTDAKQK